MAASWKPCVAFQGILTARVMFHLRSHHHFPVPVRTAFFWKKRKEERRKIEHKYDGPTEFDRLQNLKKRTSVQTVKGYKPRDDVRHVVENSAKDLFGETENLEGVSLDDRRLKFKLLTRLMKEFDHVVPNLDLHHMNTVKDVVKFFETEVRDTSSFEDLSKLDLPKNLYIQMEPIRFDPETDTMFGGKSAFPGRPTVVTSIKYRRKYKGHDGGKVK